MKLQIANCKEATPFVFLSLISGNCKFLSILCMEDFFMRRDTFICMRSKAFALRIIKLYRFLIDEKRSLCFLNRL